MNMPTKFLYFLCCLASSPGVSADHSFNFAINTPGSPPFLYLDKTTNSYKGLIPDLLKEVSKQHSITVNYVDSNQQRIEVLLSTGKIDGFFSSGVWLENPNKLISSRNITAHKSYIYSARPFPKDFTFSDIKGSSICTRKHYSYPSANAFFDNGSAQRVDSSERLSMLNMLIKDRCQYTIMHQYNADALLNLEQFIKTQVYRSSLPNNEVFMAIFLRPELVDIKQYIDSVVLQMKNSGKLDAFIDYHVKTNKNQTIIEK
jgi:ABC-type amino acid transport substrate-binding protein